MGYIGDMKTKIQFFDTESEADWTMNARNQARRRAGNRRDLFVVVDGPENNFAVMHIDDAIKGGFNYRWEV